jgi:hypothetical protein
VWSVIPRPQSPTCIADTLWQCLAVVNPANDAPTVLVNCEHFESSNTTLVNWYFDAPGDNQSVQLAGTNLSVIYPWLVRAMLTFVP